MKEVAALYQQATKKAPEQKSVLDALATRAAGAGKAGDYPQGMKSLDELAAASQKVLDPPPQAADGAAFKARMKEVLPVYQQAAKMAPDAKAELDKLAAQAASAGKDKNYAGAVDLLARLEERSNRVLRDAEVKAATKGSEDAAAAPPPAPPLPEPKAAKPVEEPAAPVVSFVVLQQCRLAWDAARGKARDEIEALQEAILEESKEDPKAAIIAKMVRRFDRVRDQFDTALLDKLDAALNAKDPKKRSALNTQAGGMIRQLLAYMASEPLLSSIDDNPFLPVTVNKDLTAALKSLAGKLA